MYQRRIQVWKDWLQYKTFWIQSWFILFLKNYFNLQTNLLKVLKNSQDRFRKKHFIYWSSWLSITREKKQHTRLIFRLITHITFVSMSVCECVYKSERVGIMRVGVHACVTKCVIACVWMRESDRVDIGVCVCVKERERGQSKCVVCAWTSIFTRKKMTELIICEKFS